MKFFTEQWGKFTNDPWILSAVSGYKIDFVEKPFQDKIPNEIPFKGAQWQLVNDEVQSLLQKGAIVVTEHEPGEFISTLFLVPKPNGKFRPVINLRYLNEFVSYNHFKQETFNIVLDLIQKNDFFTKLDLSDAYFSVPIHEDDTKFLKFSWNGFLYKFVCLPFGLSIAPYLFTKILKPVYAWFRQQNIRCSYYIDDSLNMNQSNIVCAQNSDIMVHTISSLGFSINRSKSILVPCQRIVFFGFFIDSVAFKVYLTADKVQKILTKSKQLLEKGKVIIRELASFIGLIINAFYAVFEAKLHFRDLERNKVLGLNGSLDYDREVVLSPSCLQELHWWSQNIVSKNGKLIRPSPVELRCRTDASLAGYGGIDLISDKHVNGRWSYRESVNSINYLELLAVFYSLQALYHDTCNTHIEVQSDNTTTVSYINEFGGMHSVPMDCLAKQIWAWCIERNIYVSAVYIPGIENTADFFSRTFSESTEWMLKQDIFDRLCKHFFLPSIDLFATRLNKRLNKFVSWYPEPGTTFVNAFNMSWHGLLPYVFPPFNLVGKVLNKIVSDKVDQAICIFPEWRSQPWFPSVLENLCSFPVRLPRHKDLLTLPHNNRAHPLGKRLKLIAAVVSGNPCRIEAFHRNLQNSCCSLGQLEHVSSINMPGNCGVLGTILGFQIPFVPLKRV